MGGKSVAGISPGVWRRDCVCHRGCFCDRAADLCLFVYRILYGIFCGSYDGGMVMRMFLYEYGRILLTVMLSIIVLGAAFSGFMRKWQQMGGVTDSVKTNFLTDEEKRTPPVLTAHDFKIHEGEEIKIDDYVSAVDYDGSDISQRIQMERQREKPGIWRYALRVTSPVTGKTVRGSLVVLVDCAREGGEGAVCG